MFILYVFVVYSIIQQVRNKLHTKLNKERIETEWYNWIVLCKLCWYLFWDCLTSIDKEVHEIKFMKNVCRDCIETLDIVVWEKM